MTRSLVVVVAFVVLALGVAALKVDARKPDHCGCVNKAVCVEPCTACCGPNGYEDCFKNPSPTSATVQTSSCCAVR